jgi:hypothetical protein
MPRRPTRVDLPPTISALTSAGAGRTPGDRGSAVRLQARRLAVVVLDSEHYAALIDRLEYLEDSLAALSAREDRIAVAGAEIRE